MSNPIEELAGVLGNTSISEQLRQLRIINERLAHEQQTNTELRAAARTSTAEGASGGSWLDQLGRVWGEGMGMVSLVSGLVDLFGGGDSSGAPVSPAKYMQPLPIQLEAGFSNSQGGGAFAVDASQGNLPRAITNSAGNDAWASGGAQITVNVQTLDSKSFLDHSNEIALAVRQAMLETTVLNDVIRGV